MKIRVICFKPVTMIVTPSVIRRVETLRAGDRVFPRDNVIQDILWTGRHTLTFRF